MITNSPVLKMLLTKYFEQIGKKYIVCAIIFGTNMFDSKVPSNPVACLIVCLRM